MVIETNLQHKSVPHFQVRYKRKSGIIYNI